MSGEDDGTEGDSAGAGQGGIEDVVDGADPSWSAVVICVIVTYVILGVGFYTGFGLWLGLYFIYHNMLGVERLFARDRKGGE